MALARKMRDLYKKRKIASRFSEGKKEYFFDIDAIQRIMPHRYPFLLVDRILDLEPDKRVRALKKRDD